MNFISRILFKAAIFWKYLSLSTLLIFRNRWKYWSKVQRSDSTEKDLQNEVSQHSSPLFKFNEMHRSEMLFPISKSKNWGAKFSLDHMVWWSSFNFYTHLYSPSCSVQNEKFTIFLIKRSQWRNVQLCSDSINHRYIFIITWENYSFSFNTCNWSIIIDPNNMFATVPLNV